MDRSDQRPAARVLGITGPIGCGKTTVGDMLLELGAYERIDADRVVHQLMGAGTQTSIAVGMAFGSGILNEDGSVNRARLGEIVFRDPAKLRALEEIVHPAVRKVIREQLDRAGPGGVTVLDAVKLLQSDLLPLTETVWVVQCAYEAQLQRLTDRGLSSEAAMARIGAQPDFDDPHVSRVISNSGSLSDLRRQVGDAWLEFNEREVANV